jgi:DNA-directed RNA polymerase subunit RPC12/RpoP
MAKVICPHCGAEVRITAQSVTFFENVPVSLTCSRCRKTFNIPTDIRKKLQADKDIDDLATLDFLSDGEIDGHIF